jgi:hypothetical protein
MRIHVCKVSRFDSLRGIFRKDGWSLTEASGESLWLSHPEAPDQNATRQRLSDLGLLTSRRLRIEFENNPERRRITC